MSDPLDRVPPHSLEAEQAALASAILSAEAWGAVSAVCDEAAFYSRTHRRVYAAIAALHSCGAPVDTLTVADELRSAGALDAVGGVDYLFALVNAVPTPAHADHYARIVAEHAARRRVIAAAEKALAAAYAEDIDPDELARLAQVVAAAAAPCDGDRGVVLRRLSDVTPEDVRWLWPGRIPLGKLTVLDGDPGLGKSTLTLDLAARVTLAGPMPDGTRSDLDGPAGVVLLTAEDDLADTVRPRLDAAGADSGRVVALTGKRAGECVDSVTLADIAALERAISQEGAALVIIDPLMAYVPARMDTHRDADIRRLLAPLAALAGRTGAAIVVVRHLNKLAGGTALYRGGGSIGIIGAARAGLLVGRDPGDPTGERRVLAVSKLNLGRPAPSFAYRIEEADGAARIVWEGESPLSADDLVAIRRAATSAPARDEAEAFLLDLLAGGPLPSAEVQALAAEAGIGVATLQRAKRSLRIESSRVGGAAGDGHWEWSLPPAISAAGADERLTCSTTELEHVSHLADERGVSANGAEGALQARNGRREPLQTALALTCSSPHAGRGPEHVSGDEHVSADDESRERQRRGLDL